MIQDVSEVTLPVDDGASKVQFSNMTSVVEALEETLQEEVEEIVNICYLYVYLIIQLSRKS